MQSVSADFTNAINNSYSLYTQPKAIAEFNMNMIFPIQSVANHSSDVGADEEYYPIDSIVLANRPTAGMAKAKIGKSKVSKFGEVRQFRTVSEKAVYKYWSTDGVSNSGGSITGVQPYVLYTNPVPCNKIRVTIENSYSYPSYYGVYITTNGSTWTLVSSSPPIGPDGVVNLYLQDDGTWGNTENINNSTNIKGVLVYVVLMNKPNARFELIEISALLRKDLSNDIIDMSIDKEISNQSLLYPLGDVSANSANLTLDNSNETYVNSNINSPYYELLKKNVKVELYLGINPNGYDNAGLEWIRQGIFYVDTWGNEDDYSTQVSLTDFTKFLQQQKLVPTLFQNKKVSQIIRAIFNMIGRNNMVEMQAKDSDGSPLFFTDYVIPYFWITSTDMAWDLIQQLCQATQGCVYFDEDENLQYISRAVLTGNKFINGHFRGLKDDSGLADIVDISHDYDVQINKVTVNFKPLDIQKDQYGGLLPTAVWTAGQDTPLPNTTTANGTTTTITITDNNQSTTAGDAVSIPSSYLLADMNNSQMTVTIDAKRCEIFPFESYLNIDGEIMHYKGKQYKYYPNNNFNPSYTTVYSEDDILNVDNNQTNQYMRYYNGLTGLLMLTERGMWGSQETSHSTAITGWSGGHWSTGGGFSSSNNFGQDRSTLRLQGNDDSLLTNYMAISPVTGITTNRSVGTEVYFPANGVNTSLGGMFLNLQSNSVEGIYIFLAALSTGVTNVSAYYVDSSGIGTKLDSAPMAVAKTLWYQIDVVFDSGSSTYEIYVNGDLKLNFTDTHFSSGRCGVVTKGNTAANFEYFYAISDEVPPGGYDPRVSTFLDRVQGDYVSGFIPRQVMFDKKWNKKQKRYNKYTIELFDDFGPYVHEMRKFDIQYQNSPVIGPFMYLSNDVYADLIRWDANAFGATFYIVNKNRASIGLTGLAVVQGKDYEYFTGQEVDQTTTINGYVLTSGDQKTTVITNDSGISNYGANELTIDSSWIQTVGEANDVAAWITSNWGDPIENISANVWVNPAQQLADVMTVNYPRKGYNNDIYYRVEKISIGWSGGGLTGNIGLVRIP